MQFFPFFVHSRIFYFPRFFNGGKTGGRFFLFFSYFLLAHQCFFILKKSYIASFPLEEDGDSMAIWEAFSPFFFLFHPSKLIQKEKNKKGKEKEKEKKKRASFLFFPSFSFRVFYALSIKKYKKYRVITRGRSDQVHCMEWCIRLSQCGYT